MSNFKYTAGLNHVGSYQVSGAPFLTSSVDATQAVKVEFPYVTSWVVIQNNAHANTEHLKVGFSQITFGSMIGITIVPKTDPQFYHR